VKIQLYKRWRRSFYKVSKTRCFAVLTIFVAAVAVSAYSDVWGASGGEPVACVDIPGTNWSMGKYLVTNAQYCEYLNSANSDGIIKIVGGVVYASTDLSNSQPYVDMHSYDFDSQIDYDNGVFSVRKKDSHDMSNHPVVELSFYGASAFCNYYGYRLPTEDEWEYAARGGVSGMTFPWGNTWDNNRGNCYNSGDPYESGYKPWTTPVDYYPAQNDYGLHDIAGNVWEWTTSCYYPDCSDDYRILRGGGWGCDWYLCRIVSIGTYTAETRGNLAGFRVVKDDAQDCPCVGDMNGDGWLSAVDLNALVNTLIPHASNSYWTGAPEGSCGDLNGDGWLSPVDLNALVSELLPHRSNAYWVRCE